MAFFPITAFWQLVLMGFGIYLIERGKFSRFISIIVFLTELGFVGQPQFYITDSGSPLAQASLFLPLSISTVIGSFFTMMTYLAAVSALDIVGRDFLGRKRKPV